MADNEDDAKMIRAAVARAKKGKGAKGKSRQSSQEQEEVWIVMSAMQVLEVTQGQEKEEKAKGFVSGKAQKGRVDKATGKFLESNVTSRCWDVGLRRCALQCISLFHARVSTAFVAPIAAPLNIIRS